MSAVEIRDAGWQAIMDDERLAGARRKLSFHEIRLIVDHARTTPPLDSEAVDKRDEEILRLVDALKFAHDAGFEWPVDPLPFGSLAHDLFIQRGNDPERITALKGRG